MRVHIDHLPEYHNTTIIASDSILTVNSYALFLYGCRNIGEKVDGRYTIDASMASIGHIKHYFGIDKSVLLPPTKSLYLSKILDTDVQMVGVDVIYFNTLLEDKKIMINDIVMVSQYMRSSKIKWTCNREKLYNLLLKIYKSSTNDNKPLIMHPNLYKYLFESSEFDDSIINKESLKIYSNEEELQRFIDICDVYIEYGDSKVGKYHKFVLAYDSPVFKKELLDVDKYKIDGDEADVTALINACYSVNMGIFENCSENLLKLLIKYEVDVTFLDDGDYMDKFIRDESRSDLLYTYYTKINKMSNYVSSKIKHGVDIHPLFIKYVREYIKSDEVVKCDKLKYEQFLTKYDFWDVVGVNTLKYVVGTAVDDFIYSDVDFTKVSLETLCKYVAEFNTFTDMFEFLDEIGLREDVIRGCEELGLDIHLFSDIQYLIVSKKEDWNVVKEVATRLNTNLPFDNYELNVYHLYKIYNNPNLKLTNLKVFVNIDINGKDFATFIRMYGVDGLDFAYSKFDKSAIPSSVQILLDTYKKEVDSKDDAMEIKNLMKILLDEKYDHILWCIVNGVDPETDGWIVKVMEFFIEDVEKW